jgi:hypothetical protein
MPDVRTSDHDELLFDALLASLGSSALALQRRRMFGCPAAFVGRRLAFCVYGDAIAAKLPQALAQRLLDEGRAEAFRPFGRPPMKQWVQVRATVADASRLRPLLERALQHAAEHGEPG